MPSTTHGSAAGFQIETETNQHLLVAQARGNQKLSAAGLRSVLAALDTYYSSTLSTAQKAAMPDFCCSVTAACVTAYAAPGTEPTLAAALQTAIGTNTIRG